MPIEKNDFKGFLSFLLPNLGGSALRAKAVVIVNPETGDPASVGGGGGGGGGSGDASAANQLAGNASLASIDSKAPALQAGKVPVLASVQGIRQDAAGPAAADGAAHPMLFNEDGRLKVAATPAQYAAVTGAINASGGVVSADVSACSNVVLYVTGTFAGHNVAFEASIDGGATWFGIQAARSNANLIEAASGVLAAAPAYAWEASVNAYTHVRVRATAHTSGTANWRITLGTYATEPSPAIQTHPVSQSGTWNIGTVTGATVTPAAATPYSRTTTASTNAAVVKASAGTLFEISVSNVTATATFVKLYNKATAPTVGTDVPGLTIPVAAGATLVMAFGTMGKRFTAGIGIATTAAAPAADTAATVAGIQIHGGFL